jgi:hypothetical protein
VLSKFNVIQIDQSVYDACIIIQTYQSLHELKPELTRLNNVHGKVLLDTLFHSGNVNDRFIELDTNNGKLDWSSARTAYIDKQDEIRTIIAKALEKTPEILNNSILSSIQKKLLSRGIGI